MSGTPNADFDERLAEALNLALSDGEEIVAREAGDQGQAIALTEQHIILVRVGLAATGEMDGHKTTKFVLTDITAVNFRKGALGAVIQVCSNGSHAGTPNGAPDNVIVFTGPGRVKKAEAFAETIEFATGKAVNRIEPHSQPDQQAAPEPPKGDRERVSLAEEIYNETMQSQSQPAEPAIQAEAPQETVEAAPVDVTEPVTVAVASEPEVNELTTREGHNPNPRLPKPIRKREHGPNKMLVVLGVLAGLTAVGMAVMAPMREAQIAPAPIVGTSYASVTQRSLRLQLAAVSNYHKQVSELVAKANADASAFRSAVRSANQSAIQSASRSTRIDDAWQKLSILSAPPGLAEAGEDLTNGLLSMKSIAASAGSSGTVDTAEILSRFDESDAQIRTALAAIAARRSSLEKQAAEIGKRRSRKPLGVNAPAEPSRFDPVR